MLYTVVFEREKKNTFVTIVYFLGRNGINYKQDFPLLAQAVYTENIDTGTAQPYLHQQTCCNI